MDLTETWSITRSPLCKPSCRRSCAILLLVTDGSSGYFNEPSVANRLRCVQSPTSERPIPPKSPSTGFQVTALLSQPCLASTAGRAHGRAPVGGDACRYSPRHGPPCGYRGAQDERLGWVRAALAGRRSSPAALEQTDADSAGAEVRAQRGPELCDERLLVRGEQPS